MTTDEEREERLRQERSERARKAARIRAENQRKVRDERIWSDMQDRLKKNPCNCKFKKGMTLDDLDKMGAGCTGNAWPQAQKHKKPLDYAEMIKRYGDPRPVYVCPNLEAFRRLLGKRPAPLPINED